MAFDLQPNPDGARWKSFFVEAFNRCADHFNLWIWEDPNDFEDEGDALKTLCVYLCRREFFPEMEMNISKSAGPLGGRLIGSFRVAAAKTVSKTVQAQWTVAREAFNKAKDWVNTKYGELSGKIETAIKGVVGAVVGKVLEKLPSLEDKSSASEKEKGAEKEKTDGFPGVERLEFTAKLIDAVKTQSASTAALREFKALFQREFTLKRKMTRKVQGYIREVPDYSLQWTMRRLLDAVEGVIELFQSQMVALLDGLIPFFAARDTVEEKFKVVAGDGTKSIGACESESKKIVEDAAEAMKESLKKTAVDMGHRMWWNKSELRWSLRELTGRASRQLMDLVQILPEKTLNFLASFRLNFVRLLPSVWERVGKDNENKVTADKVGECVRALFVESAAEAFNAYFAVIWVLLRSGVYHAAQHTCVDKLFAVVQPAMEAAMKLLANVLPAELNSMIDVEKMATLAAAKALEAAAALMVLHYARRLEAYVFAAADPVNSQDEEDEKKREEEARSAKEKKAKEDEQYAKKS